MQKWLNRFPKFIQSIHSEHIFLQTLLYPVTFLAVQIADLLSNIIRNACYLTAY